MGSILAKISTLDRYTSYGKSTYLPNSKSLLRMHFNALISKFNRTLLISKNYKLWVSLLIKLGVIDDRANNLKV